MVCQSFRWVPTHLQWVDRVADALRLVAALSIVVAGLLYGWSGALVFIVVSAVVWVPRIAALPRPVGLSIGITWLVAGWANATHLYVTDPWVDIPIHATTPGASAAAVYLLLVRVQLIPELTDRQVRRRALVLITFALGATIAVLWEFYEWLRYHGQGAPLVGYNNTIPRPADGLSRVPGGWRRAGPVGSGGLGHPPELTLRRRMALSQTATTQWGKLRVKREKSYPMTQRCPVVTGPWAAALSSGNTSEEVSA